MSHLSLTQRGATTLYLPGMEVTWDPAEGTEEATRYYTHADETIAVREDDGSLHWIFSDHQGTGQISIDAVWGNTVQRRFTVFGEDRGTSVDWHGQKGFVGGVIDESTGLTQLGARSYDASLGRFISVDPILNLTDSQQMHGYSYANNSPITYSDPDGLHPCSHLAKCLPGKGKPGLLPRTPNTGTATASATGRAYGTGRGTSTGWGGSGGGKPRTGPTGYTPRAPEPYSEPDFRDPAGEALAEAGHHYGEPWAPGENWGECASSPGVVAAGASCVPTQSLKDGINELIDSIPEWARLPIIVLGTALIAVAAIICSGACVVGALFFTAMFAIWGMVSYRLTTAEEDRSLWGYFMNGLNGALGGGLVGLFRKLWKASGSRVILSWPPRISGPAEKVPYKPKFPLD